MIYVECYSDKLFFEVLFPSSNVQIQHKRIGWGRGNILRLLNNPLNQKNIGIVDEDNRTQLENAISKFHLIEETNELIFYDNPQNKSFLIVLRPKFEDWLLKASFVSKIKLKKFNLEPSSSYLHKLSTEKGCIRLKPLFNALKESSSPEIKNLKELILKSLKSIKSE